MEFLLGSIKYSYILLLYLAGKREHVLQNPMVVIQPIGKGGEYPRGSVPTLYGELKNEW
jgi:hypothetical protein